MIEELKQYLAHRQKKHIFDPKRVATAVLVPLYCKDGQYHILFVLRSETVKDHKGQISFPGGHFDKIDGTLRNTALRECTEEIGVTADNVEILGELDDALTLTSSYVITPFVALILYPCRFTLEQREIAAIMEIPIQALLDEACLEKGTAVPDGHKLETYFYHYQGKVIWGATARILHDLLQIVAACPDRTCR